MTNKGGRGRRTPTSWKVLAGNPGKGPVPRPPDLPPGVPDPPAGLPGPAVELYHRLAAVLGKAGLLTQADGQALGDLALCLVRVQELEELVGREGLVIDSPHGRKAHPALQFLKAYRAAAQRWAAEFGLTPKARGLLDVRPEGEQDPLAELLETR